MARDHRKPDPRGEGGFWLCRVLSVLVILAVTLLLGSCGSGSASGGSPGPSVGPGTGGATGGNSIAPFPHFVYGAQDAGSEIQVGAVDANGNITAGPTANTNANDMIVSFAHTPDGRFLYSSGVAGSAFGMPIGNNAIAMFSVDPKTGALNAVSGSPMIESGRPGALVMDRSGSYLYAPMNNAWTTYTVNASTGVLSSASSGGQSGFGIQNAITPDGRYLLSGSGQNLYVNSVTGSTVASVSGSPFTVGVADSNITAMAVSKDGTLFIATQPTLDTNPPPTTTIPGGIIPYRLSSTGQPTALAQIPFETGQQPLSMAITLDGKHLYVVTEEFGGASAFVEGYTIGANGALTPVTGSPYAANSPEALAIDSSGKFLYVTGDSGTTVYRIDAASGALTQASVSSIPTGVFSTTLP